MERELVAAARARVGEVGERAGREVVDDVDVAALGEQPVDERRADEAGPARDERSHPGRHDLDRHAGAREPRVARLTTDRRR